MKTQIFYSKSFLDFLQTSQGTVQRLLYHAYLHQWNVYDLLLTTDEVNYLTFRSDGTISYLPAGKPHLISDNGEWSREGRQNGKAGKIIRKLFTPRAQKLLKDADFECFTNFYKSHFIDEGYRFTLLPCKAIPAVYQMDRAKGDASLNGSCMNDYSGRFKIYAECKQLSILTLTNKEGLLCGRSLIWKVADSVTLMDRIYVTEDFMYEKFVDYAKQQKYWYKRYYKTYDNRTEFIDHEGTYRNKTFVINTPTDFDSYPYIDTFRYGGDGFLTNRQIDGCIYEYENTNGEREENDSGIYDDITGLYIDEDNATQVDRGERRGDTTHIDNVVDVHGRNYWVGDSGITEIDGTYYLNDEVVYSDYDSCYYLIDDCVYSEHYGSHIVAWRAIKVDGDYYYESDVKLINGTYQLKQA